MELPTIHFDSAIQWLKSIDWVHVAWVSVVLLLLGNRTFIADSAEVFLIRPFMRLVKYLWQGWKHLVHRRWEVIRSWWSCKTKRCDYYQIYQAYGPADLTHVGFHAGERLALKHFFDHCQRDDHAGCEDCKECQDWAERLRADVWKQLLKKYESGAERKKPGHYGFQAGACESPEED